MTLQHGKVGVGLSPSTRYTYLDESCVVSQNTWNLAIPRMSERGPKNKPIIVSTPAGFNDIFGQPSSNGRRYDYDTWSKMLPDFLKEKEPKRIINDLDPYGEENWEE